MADETIDKAHVEKMASREQQAALAWMSETPPPAQDQQSAQSDQPDKASDRSLSDLIAERQRPQEQWWQTAIRNISPVEFMGGVLDYADNAFQTVRQISAKGDKALMDLGIPAYTSEGFTTDYAKFAETKNVGDYIPDIGNPDQPGIARNIGKFAAGYMTAGRMLQGVQSIQTLAQSGRFGASAVAALKGAISDFSGLGAEERNLANFIEQYPTLQNPVTDFLAAKDESPEVVNKLKTAIVGAGLGMAADGIFAGLRSIRAGKQVIDKANQLDELASGLVNEAETQRSMITDVLGSPDDARLLLDAGDVAQAAGNAADDAAKAGLGGATNPRVNDANRIGDVYVNWSRIDSQDDVKTVIQDLANRFSDSIDEGRRGVQTFGQIADDAATEDAWKLLTERAQGQPLNASQTLAVRQLWTSSGSKVLELSRRVEAGGSVADQVALRKMIAVHAAIQEQVIGIRTETARALAQWRIPAGESDQFLSGMGQMLDMMGGTSGDTLQMARAINSLADQGRVDATDAFLMGANQIDKLKSLGANASDMISQLYYFSLLSGPKTHVRNSLSNTAMLLANVADRKSASILGRMLGGQNVPDGESAALAYGELQGALDAFRVSAATREAAKASGQPARSPFMQALTSGQAADLVKGEALPAGAFDPAKLGMDPNSAMGRVMDWIDTATRSPTNALAAGDAVFRTANYNGQVHALAFRQAMNEVDAGIITREMFDQRVGDLARNPDTAMRLLAQRFAEVSIFANRPPQQSKLYNAMNAIARVPVLGKIAMPFRKTPYNIAIEFAQRSPTAPLTLRFREEIAAGGARADIAWSKFLTGNLTLIALADIARRGFVTGEPTGFDETAPGEYATRRQMGERPMSLKFKSEDGSVRTFSFRGLEPFSTLLGMAANVNQILSSDQFDAEDKDLEDVVVAATAAISTQVTAPSFMTGMSDLIAFMDSPDRYAETFSERLAGTAVPNLMAEATRALDPTIRDANGMIEAIMARTPGLSKTLPPNTDRWGKDLTRESGLGTVYDVVSPFYSSSTKPEPIDSELYRLEMGLPKPSKALYIDGVKINMKQFPKEYTRYVKLAGNEVRETIEGYPITTGFGFVSEGGGLLDELNAIVEGRHGFSSIYELGTDGPDGDKAAFIQGIVNAYRNEAKAHLLQEFPALRAHLVMKREEQPERVFQRERRAGFLDRTE